MDPSNATRRRPRYHDPRVARSATGPTLGLHRPPAASEVARVDVDRGTFETVASGFDRPVALKFDSQHRLHVLDSGTGELFRVDIANGEKELVGRTGAGSDNLAFDADDRLFSSCRATPTASSWRSSDPRRPDGRCGRRQLPGRPGLAAGGRGRGGGCFSPTDARCGSWIPRPARRSTWCPAASVGFLSGIAVGDGSLYLSSYAENRVYRIDR